MEAFGMMGGERLREREVVCKSVPGGELQGIRELTFGNRLFRFTASWLKTLGEHDDDFRMQTDVRTQCSLLFIEYRVTYGLGHLMAIL